MRLHSLFPGNSAQGILAVGFVVLVASPARAQWNTQTITLQGGWNAVFFEVQPEPRDCDTLFRGLQAESVWRFNRRSTTVQFIQDPNRLIPNQPDWLTWLPMTNPLRNPTNRASLLLIEGGQPYLIKRADNAAATNWTVIGRPTLRKIEWLPNSFNFIGLPLPLANGPSYSAFFGPSPALDTNVYRLLSGGTWQRVLNPVTTLMQPNHAFWIKSKGQPEYSGPLFVETGQSGRLDYGRILSEQTVHIRNASAVDAAVTIRQLPSATAPAGFPPVAGGVPLYYWNLSVSTIGSANVMAWHPLAELSPRTLAPAEEWTVRLAVRRNEMSATPDPTALYQSLLEVSVPNSSRVLLPITASGPTANLTAQAFAPAAVGAPAPGRHVGLWVGSVTIANVSQPESVDPLALYPVGSPFQFRIMLHVTSNGQARLLQKIWQVWKDGTSSNGVVTQPGRFVLLTDGARLKDYSGATIRDNAPVARRISTAAFGFKNPIPMFGDFGGGSLRCTNTLDYNDPVNPFKHRYHPCHDNLDADFASLIPEGEESFSITNNIELQFDSAAPTNLELTEWGDNTTGGAYRGAMIGLHRLPIYVQGSFRLQRASRIPRLNDEN